MTAGARHFHSNHAQGCCPPQTAPRFRTTSALRPGQPALAGQETSKFLRSDRTPQVRYLLKDDHRLARWRTYSGSLPPGNRHRGFNHPERENRTLCSTWQGTGCLAQLRQSIPAQCTRPTAPAMKLRRDVGLRYQARRSLILLPLLLPTWPPWLKFQFPAVPAVTRPLISRYQSE